MRELLRRRSSAIGVGLIAASIVLLIGLRFIASPIARRIVGIEETPVGLVPFLGIPVFLGFTAIGIALLLWEPGGVDGGPGQDG